MKPLYIQLSDQLIEEIRNNMEVGDLLPSERKLAEIYDMSRTTVRLALNNLENKGYISTQHGKGSFVIDHHKTLINLSEMYSFTDQMQDIGKKPETILLDFSIISNPDELKKDIYKNEKKLIKLIRLRSADKLPMLYEESYLPFSKFKDISEEEINRRALYDIFFEDYNQVVKLAQEEFFADIVSKKVAEHLKIDTNSPILKISRTTYNLNNEIIEYTKSDARSDQFSYRTIHHNYLTKK